jgi:hypothetical protein
LALALAILVAPLTVGAQSGTNGGPASFSVAGGAFAPLPAKGSTGAAAPTWVDAAIKRTAAAYSSGSPQRSPATGQLIVAEAVQVVGELITSGSPAAEARLARALQASGASPDAVAFLTQALADLARVSPASAPIALRAATKQYNLFVASLPPGFLRNPPGHFLAVHAALVAMVNGVRR